MTTALAMDGVITFVEGEHRELAAGVARIEEAASRMEVSEAHEAGQEVHAVLRWFDRAFAQHLAWEDAFVSPELDRVTGTACVGRLLRFEHRQLRAAFADLEAAWLALRPVPGRETLAALRARLTGLAVAIRGHLEREEWVLLPLLEQGRPA
jgi:hemerythrin-like domain-containing protein